MADINVDVILPNPITVDVTSPTQALATNVSVPGPQGPTGPRGAPTAINNISNEYIYISGADGITVLNSGINTIFISGNSGYFQSAVNTLTTNLNSTGSSLINSINSLSGLFTGHTGSLDNDYATDAQLQSTGSNLYTLLINFSGNLDANYATDTQLFNTGSSLDGKINSLSGYSASIVNLASTGSTLDSKINSLSGYSASINNLQSTGSNLYSMLTEFSGNLDATYATDSQLATTGSTLDNKINSLSGYSASAINLASTGSNLYTLITNFSGNLDTDFASQAELNSLSGYVNSQDTSISNNLTSTGSTLNTKINNVSGYINSSSSNIIFTTGNQIKSGRLIIGDTIVDASYPYTLSLQSNTQETWLEILNHSGANQGVFFGIAGNNFEQWNSQAGDILFVTSENPMDGTERLRIKNDGKVGIGTSSPSEKLEVNGNIKANNLVYNTGNQTVSGIKTFTEDLVVQKSGFFWSGIKIGLNSIIITEESIKISGDPVIVQSTFTGYTGDVVNTYATITNLASTGSTLQSSINTLTNNLNSTGSSLDNKIGSLSGTLTSTYATISNLSNTGSTLNTRINDLSGHVNNQDTTISNNLTTTGSTLNNKINSLSGAAVLKFDDQIIYGTKYFNENVYIHNLYVTGDEFIANVTNNYIESPYLLLNLTGGAIDGGIFFVTGSGFTGINDYGPIIGFDHSDKFKFGVARRSDDLSFLPDIASVQELRTYSGVANNTFSTIINLASTGSTLDSKINSLSGWSASAVNLASTGSNLNTRINNLSGYINSTSSNIVFTTGNQTISGIKSFAQDTTFGDSTQGDFLVISGNNFTVYGSGNFTSGLFVNSSPVLTGSSTLYATTVNLTSTGSTLVTSINSLSGTLTGNYLTTSSASSTYATITNLGSTGSTLDSKISSLSGTLTSTYATITNLASTGSTLNTNINSLSGTLTSNYATITNLANTGSTLQTNINNLSGYINSSSSNIVFTTGNQTISGNKTFNNTLSVRTISGLSGAGSPTSVDIKGMDNALLVFPNNYLGGNINLTAGSGNLAGGSINLSAGTYGSIAYGGQMYFTAKDIYFNQENTYPRTVYFHKTGAFSSTSNLTISQNSVDVYNNLTISGNYDLYSQIENAKKLAIAYAIAL